MTYRTKNGITVAIVDSAVRIEKVQVILDLIVTAWYESEAAGLIIEKASLPESFFDLRTGFAGDVLQKFSNYRMKLAILGDFSSFTSKSLHNFIYESNKGNLVFFKSDINSAIDALVQ